MKTSYQLNKEKEQQELINRQNILYCEIDKYGTFGVED
jgi:hypothetical protein